MQTQLDSQLFTCCRDGHLKEAQYVFDLGANVNALDIEVTFIPAYKSKPLDLSNGIEVREDISPLFCAIDHGHIAIAEWLIEEGANVHYNSGHSTAIHRAIRQGDVGMLDLLINYGADVNHGTMMDTPLLYAMHLKQYNLVHLLLKSGANPDTENMLGVSAKSLAAEMHDPKMTVLLDPIAAEKSRLQAQKPPASDLLKQQWQSANQNKKPLSIKRRPRTPKISS